MTEKCKNCTHLLHIYKRSTHEEWYKCELTPDDQIIEIEDIDHTCKAFKEYRRNSCFDCWYHIPEYTDDGKLDYYYCHLTGEKLPEMKKNCEQYRKKQ